MAKTPEERAQQIADWMTETKAKGKEFLMPGTIGKAVLEILASQETLSLETLEAELKRRAASTTPSVAEPAKHALQRISELTQQPPGS